MLFDLKKKRITPGLQRLQQGWLRGEQERVEGGLYTCI
jgi:hypothetical protein